MSQQQPQSQPQSQAAPPPYRPYRLLRTLTNHDSAVSCVKFSHDGLLLASASLDKTLIIWSSSTLEPISRLSGHSEGVSDLSWSPDSHYVCSASDDRTLRIWDVHSKSCLKTLRGHTSFVFCVNFNLQSSRIASGGFDNSVRVWEVKTGKCLIAIDDAHKKPVTCVDFNRDGSLIVSGSHDGTCKIWEAEAGVCLRVVIEESKGGPSVSFAKFSPNGKFILVATLNDSLKLWSYNNPAKALKAYSGHINRIYCMTSAFSITNGKYIVSGSEDHCVYLWDLQGRQLVQKLEGHTDVVISVSCHPSINTIASAGLQNDRTVRIWIQDN